MVRVVSQEIFNETVFENRELLDLNVEEAIQETIKQLEAQGVVLTNIVKDPFILDKENPVTSIVTKLQKPLSEESEISSCINELTILCKRGIEYKLLCGREHVYDALIEKISSDISLSLLENILQCLTVFVDGYPDILDERGCILFIKMLECNPEIQKIVLKLVDVTCLKHENNRQMYMDNGLVSHITRILNGKPNNDLLCCILNTIPALTRDDDIRTATSKRYIHACSLSNDLLKPFCHLLKEKETDEPFIVGSLLTALSSMVVNNEQCLIFDSEDCVPILIHLIKKYGQNENILIKCFTLLFGLAGNDDINDKIMKLDVAPELASAMNNYINKKNVVQSALKLASRLCLRKPNHGQIFFKIDFPVFVIQAMTVHRKNGSVQAAGCWCIRNMTSRNHEFRETFLLLGAEEVLIQITSDFKDYAQDAKFALIELGCHVKLNEPWAGKDGEKLRNS